MTTPDTTFARTQPVQGHIVFPDPPEDPDDKMTSFNALTITGTAHALAVHLGNWETTLVAGEHYMSLVPTRSQAGVRYPDLLVAFGVSPEAYYRSQAYVFSEQGKPPDWVLEVASSSTGHVDVGAKRVDYAELGIPEYWRFDKTGDYHGAKLAGDRLVEGEYVAIRVEELPGGEMQGYSGVLNLYLRWAGGDLVFHDPATGESIATLEGQMARADAEQARADTQQARAEAAEARVRELEDRLRGLGA